MAVSAVVISNSLLSKVCTIKPQLNHNISQGHLSVFVISHGHKNTPLKAKVMVIEKDIRF